MGRPVSQGAVAARAARPRRSGRAVLASSTDSPAVPALRRFPRAPTDVEGGSRRQPLPPRDAANDGTCRRAASRRGKKPRQRPGRTRSPRRRYPAEAPATQPEASPRRADSDIFSQFRIRDPERFAYNRRSNRTLERHGEQESNLSRILRRGEANGNRCSEGPLYFAVISAGSPIRGKFRRALVHPVGETRIVGAGSPDFPIRRNSETDERCRQARLGTESHLPDERTSAEVDEVAILAGFRYRQYLGSYLSGRFSSVRVPMQGLRFGEQLSWLKKAVEPVEK